MKFYYITFRSVTYAQHGEKVLSAGNIRCMLMRTPKWMEEQGCGYCLRLWAKDITPAVTMLRHRQVALRKIYTQRPDGTFEELAV